MPGIEPGAFHMQSERSTAELHPHLTLQMKSIFTNYTPASQAALNCLLLSDLHIKVLLRVLFTLISCLFVIIYTI